jgi:hypothetical protein
VAETADHIVNIDADARRLVLEAIATLVYVKKMAAEQILKPAGVPSDLINRFLTERDTNTGDRRSKREAGAMILDELARKELDRDIVRNLIALAAKWNSFHLAQDEFKARAVVQKARELQGILIEADARERAEHDRRVKEAALKRQREKEAIFRQESALLLAQFDAAALEGEPQRRGYLLQDLLGRVFTLHGIPVVRAFMRNEGGEQIDGAFTMDGWHYIVECRWRAKLADIRDLDGLVGQVGRSGKQTMGLFLSMNGWSEHVVPLLKQNAEKSVILVDGYDLRSALAQHVELKRLLKEKLSALNLEAEPFLSAKHLT